MTTCLTPGGSKNCIFTSTCRNTTGTCTYTPYNHPTTHNFISIPPHYSKSPTLPMVPGSHIFSHPLKPSTCLAVCVPHWCEPSPVWLADCPSARQGPTILCFEFKVILIPDPPPAPARLPLASIKTCLCMYVCAEGNTGRFFEGWGEISRGI